MSTLTLDIDSDTMNRLERIANDRQQAIEDSTEYLLGRMLFGINRRIDVPADLYRPPHIPVMLDPTADRIRKQFRCNNCGNVVFNYYGSVSIIANGTYDADNNMVDGEEVDWFSTLGVPTEYVCPGRVMLLRPDGRYVKARCSAVYYKIGA